MIFLQIWTVLALAICVVVSLMNLMGITDAPWSMWWWWAIPCALYWLIRAMRSVDRSLQKRDYF